MIAWMYEYNTSDSEATRGVALTLEHAIEIINDECPYGYKGTITPLVSVGMDFEIAGNKYGETK
jgi:hypothetical protein